MNLVESETMQSNETLGKLVYELQLVKGFVEIIQQRLGLIRAAISELQQATSTLEGIEKEELDGSILVPIGGGSHIRANLGDVKKLIVGIGADVAVEKTILEAKEGFQTRILELEKAGMSFQKQIDDASTKINGLQREIRRISETREKKEDVRRS